MARIIPGELVLFGRRGTARGEKENCEGLRERGTVRGRKGVRERRTARREGSWRESKNG